MLRGSRNVLIGIVACLAAGGVLPARTTAGRPRPTTAVDRKECANCHEHVKSHAVTHAPVAVDACLSCHRRESIEQHTFTLREPLCASCHGPAPIDGPVVHAPVAAGQCTGCHDPHGGEDEFLLRSNSVDELCRGCHDDITGKQKRVHAGDLSCDSCHLPHASEDPFLLLQPPETLCLTCHEPIRRELASYQVKHAPTTEGRGCRNCHAVHSSNHPKLLADELNELCLGCHDREMTLADGEVLGNVRAELEEAVQIHDPVVDGDCGTCHLSHGGDEYRLLNAAYPDLLYVRFSEKRYALCFGCHDSEMVTTKRTRVATEFRNGDLNLHHVHVEKRRTCRICHRVHAGSDDRLVRVRVPYGRKGYELQLGYERSATGGRCSSSCHATASYDRITPVGAAGGP